MLKLCLDIFLSDILTYVEASLAGSGVTLSSDIVSGILVLLILVKTLGCLDGQITILQSNLNFILGKSRKINFQLISIQAVRGFRCI